MKIKDYIQFYLQFKAYNILFSLLQSGQNVLIITHLTQCCLRKPKTARIKIQSTELFSRE